MKLTDDKFFALEGREIVLKLGATNVFNALKLKDASKIHLMYDEGTSLAFSSEYENLVELGGNKFLNIVSASTNGFIPSSQFASQGFQVWKETNVLEFSLTASLHMYDSGLNQVVKPALALSKLCLPSKSNEQNKIWGQSLVPPGPNIQVLLSTIGIEVGKEDATDYSVEGVIRDPLSISIGKFLTIDNVIITKIEPSFSEVLDEDYMPVSCDLSIDFRTTEVATTNMVDKILSYIK